MEVASSDMEVEGEEAKENHSWDYDDGGGGSGMDLHLLIVSVESEIDGLNERYERAKEDGKLSQEQALFNECCERRRELRRLKMTQKEAENDLKEETQETVKRRRLNRPPLSVTNTPSSTVTSASLGIPGQSQHMQDSFPDTDEYNMKMSLSSTISLPSLGGLDFQQTPEMNMESPSSTRSINGSQDSFRFESPITRPTALRKQLRRQQRATLQMANPGTPSTSEESIESTVPQNNGQSEIGPRYICTLPTKDIVVLHVSPGNRPRITAVLLPSYLNAIIQGTPGEAQKWFIFLRHAFKLPLDTNISVVRSCSAFKTMVKYLFLNRDTTDYSFFVPDEDTELAGKGNGRVRILKFCEDTNSLQMSGYLVNDPDRMAAIRREHWEKSAEQKATGGKSLPSPKMTTGPSSICRGPNCPRECCKTKATARRDQGRCKTCLDLDVEPQDFLKIAKEDTILESSDAIQIKFNSICFNNVTGPIKYSTLPIVTVNTCKSYTPSESNPIPPYHNTDAFVAIISHYYPDQMKIPKGKISLSQKEGIMRQYMTTPHFQWVKQKVYGTRKAVQSLEHACLIKYSGFDVYRIVMFVFRVTKSLDKTEYFCVTRSAAFSKEMIKETIHDVTTSFKEATFCTVDGCGRYGLKGRRCKVHYDKLILYYLLLDTQSSRRNMVYVRFDTEIASRYYRKWILSHAKFLSNEVNPIHGFLNSSEINFDGVFPSTLREYTENSATPPRWIILREDAFPRDLISDADTLLVVLSILVQVWNSDTSRVPLGLINSRMSSRRADLSLVFSILARLGIKIVQDENVKPGLKDCLHFPTEPKHFDPAQPNSYSGININKTILDVGLQMGKLIGTAEEPPEPGADYKLDFDDLLDRLNKAFTEEEKAAIRAQLPGNGERVQHLPNIRAAYYQDQLDEGESHMDPIVHKRFRDTASFSETVGQIATLWAQFVRKPLKGGQIGVKAYNSFFTHFNDTDFVKMFEAFIWHHFEISVTVTVNLPDDIFAALKTIPEFGLYEFANLTYEAKQSQPSSSQNSSSSQLNPSQPSQTETNPSQNSQNETKPSQASSSQNMDE